MNVYTDARNYLSSRLNGFDMSSFSDEVIRDNVESSYPDGWAGFCADFERFNSPIVGKKSETLSPLAMRAKAGHMIGRKLRAYDEVVSIDSTDLELKIVVSIATVEYTSRRDSVTARRLELYVFTRESVTNYWSKPKVIEAEAQVDEVNVRFGTVRTPERVESQTEQFETCYRPGTDLTPMKGWAARAEVSHKQAHADETFQKPISHRNKTA